MSKIFKALAAVIFLSLSATVFAQCMPMNAPGPPRLWDGVRGCYVPQGTPSVSNMQQGYGGFGGQQQVFVQQPMTIMPGNQYQQQQVLQQQVLPAAAGAMNGFSKCELVGAVTGGVLGSFAKNHTGQAVLLGGLLGGMAGNAVCTNAQGQRVIVQQMPQQGVMPTQQQMPHQQGVGGCAHDPGTQMGILNLPGHPKNGQAVCARPGDTNIARWI